MRVHAFFMSILFLAAGCGGAPPRESQHVAGARPRPGQAAHEDPPPSGTPRDVQFPPIARATTTSGLELNTVRYGTLPVVYLRLVIRSGDATDPARLPGLAHFVAEMLKEGTRRRSSAELAEAVEFLGANLDVGSDESSVSIMLSAISEHLDEAMNIIAEMAMQPAFSETELRRLKRREIDRLALSSQQPGYLVRRTFFREIYGTHPYSHIDTTPEAARQVSRRQLSDWHRAHVVPNNAFLVAVGDVTPERIQQAAERAFRGWQRRDVPAVSYPAPPERTTREVIVVDRPDSVQSVIYVGNLSLARSDPQFIPLTVANQVLGGSAASRLFMDLRERRSLTYGAYSDVEEMEQVAPFIATAAVRNEVTEQAMAGFMEHLDRIVREAAPQNELTDAKRYLSDSFPLSIETAGRVASMVELLRIFNLPDDYWATYRTSIGAVTAVQAHEAARRYIHPDRALIVAVGRASDRAGRPDAQGHPTVSPGIAQPLRRYGPVRVIDTNGREIARFPAAASQAAAQ